ncbi:ABC transporter permease [Pseudovibrio ascidiaceicola]|jgi:putative ABC transport system permease protein|uniref:ABC transporter permease n=1 Tax=Pseudovibrio ascidiaceicola TaxID=285279 RepID=UPI000D69B11E|nr:ABC transporter permease [Pseudovibrio ascidiaceicola]
MLDLIYLAALNTLRNTRRSLITILSIAVGCTALITFGAFINFSFEGLRETTIRTQLGHMQIYAKGYWEKRIVDPSAAKIEDLGALQQALENIPEVSSVTQRLTFSGIGGIGNATVNMSVTGVDPERDEEFVDFEIVEEGRNLLIGDSEVGVIGRELAHGLGAKIGDWVTVMTTSVDGVINAVDFQIVGIVRTGSTEYDSVFVKVPIQIAQRALETDGVDRVIVLLEQTDTLPIARPKIEAALANLSEQYEFKQWDELAGFYEAVHSLYTGFFRIFAVIVSIVVMFSVANTMSMAVFERLGEIGALRAIGAPRRTMIWMFLYEGIFIGLLGSGAGVALAYGLSTLVDTLGGIPMPPPPSMSEGYQAYFPITFEVLASAVALAMAASLISSIYPSWVASRANIIEALQKS